MADAMTQEQIKDAASEAFDWVQNAVGENYEALPFDDWKARAAGQEAFADHQYEDVGTLKDLYGDRIYDLSGGDWAMMVLIAEEIKRIAHHTATNSAMDQMIKAWNAHIAAYGDRQTRNRRKNG